MPVPPASALRPPNPLSPGRGCTSPPAGGSAEAANQPGASLGPGHPATPGEGGAAAPGHKLVPRSATQEAGGGPEAVGLALQPQHGHCGPTPWIGGEEQAGHSGVPWFRTWGVLLHSTHIT